ncbi:MAG: hypothetical protein PHE02_05020 [Lachnospiraceae bacterium]|nr:hypothetical protein [Lachnospiraceae bacterium]
MVRGKKIFEGCRKLLALSLAAVMIFCVVPMDVKAAEAHTWTALGNGRFQLDGTAIIFEVNNQTLHVTGTGAIPDFDYWELNKTPWATAKIGAITVDGSITSIGKYVFSNTNASDFSMPQRGQDKNGETVMLTDDGVMSNLKYVNLSTKTFVADWTTFNKAGQYLIFRIKDEGVTTEMIGTIPYTSMDSITAMAQSSAAGSSFIFDNHERASSFQNSTNPTIANVWAANDKIDGVAPWTQLDKYHNGGAYTGMGSMTPNPGYIVNITQKYQGRECYQAFAAYIGDNTLGCAYNITVTDKSTARNRIMTSDTPYQFTVTIPEGLRKGGRTFKMIGLAQDVVNVFDDADGDGSTITFSSNRPTATYALIYKD